MRCALSPTNEMKCILKKKIMINHKSSSCHLKAHKMSAYLSVCSSASADTHIHAVRTFSHWWRWWLTPLSPPLRPTHSTSLSYQKPSQWIPLSTRSQAMRLLWSPDSSIAPLVHYYCDEWTNGLNRIVKNPSLEARPTEILCIENDLNDNQNVRLLSNSCALKC